jgi:hypothetical protein
VPWDAAVASRAACVGALALGVAWLVTAATDEGGLSWAMRAARVFPVAPACSAVGAWAVLLHAHVRGETLALAAIGRTESRVALPAVLGASSVSLAAALVVALFPRIGLEGFYPVAVHPNSWIWRGEAFVDLVRGVAVGIDSQPTLLPMVARSLPRTGPPAAGRAAAAIVTGVAGVALPLLAAHFVVVRRQRAHRARAYGGGRSTTVLVSVLAVALTATLFQSAAAERSPALAATVPPALLLAYAVALFRRSRSAGA